MIGRVPILFFLPQNCEESLEIAKLINDHGGLVITVVECCTFQICPIPNNASMSKECAPEVKKEFSKGVVFSSEWI